MSQLVRSAAPGSRQQRTWRTGCPVRRDAHQKTGDSSCAGSSARYGAQRDVGDALHGLRAEPRATCNAHNVSALQQRTSMPTLGAQGGCRAHKECRAHRSASRCKASITHGGCSARCRPMDDAAAVAGVIHRARGTLSTVAPERTALCGTAWSQRMRHCGVRGAGSIFCTRARAHRSHMRPRPSATAPGRTADVSTP